jgi:cohesin complex subunit SA-1/2
VPLQVLESNVASHISQALIDGLPRLFIKNQSDPNRIATVLLIPPLLNLDVYVEMRTISVRDLHKSSCLR